MLLMVHLKKKIHFSQIFSVTTEPGTEEDVNVEGAGFMTSTKLYIVIACIVALIIIAIIQASCTIYRMSKKSSSKKVNKMVLEPSFIPDFPHENHPISCTHSQSPILTIQISCTILDLLGYLFSCVRVV